MEAFIVTSKWGNGREVDGRPTGTYDSIQVKGRRRKRMKKRLHLYCRYAIECDWVRAVYLLSVHLDECRSSGTNCMRARFHQVRPPLDGSSLLTFSPWLIRPPLPTKSSYTQPLILGRPGLLHPPTTRTKKRRKGGNCLGANPQRARLRQLEAFLNSAATRWGERRAHGGVFSCFGRSSTFCLIDIVLFFHISTMFFPLVFIWLWWSLSDIFNVKIRKFIAGSFLPPSRIAVDFYSRYLLGSPYNSAGHWWSREKKLTTHWRNNNGRLGASNTSCGK